MKYTTRSALSYAVLALGIGFVIPTQAVSTPNQPSAEVSALKAASNKGDITSTRKLADAYRTGQGIEKNPETAFSLYVEAARAGDAEARYRVGSAYHRGEGTDSNQISAWVWLTLASRDESPVKDEALTLRKTVTKSLTEAQQSRAKILSENLEQMLMQ
ncbi:tetratricopeptide repeat protein [Sansalvadorimonas verongulae]|uniref:tetratricopeptide repeat protein n=1 Tax=Sansalvadorimonas verongulae TaxID=2172824 RepID=UPI0012BD0FAA|nr:SEL1-like repeat protein [Sansalvadorimonas verongulae]MTI12432.1 sel1 repeat family protein [Sansalvadorimonas verongulae]